MATTLTELPIVDMSLVDGDDTDRAMFRQSLLAATHEVGFFYLVGHGIDRDTRDLYISSPSPILSAVSTRRARSTGANRSTWPPNTPRSVPIPAICGSTAPTCGPSWPVSGR